MKSLLFAAFPCNVHAISDREYHYGLIAESRRRLFLKHGSVAVHVLQYHHLAIFFMRYQLQSQPASWSLTDADEDADNGEEPPLSGLLHDAQAARLSMSLGRDDIELLLVQS